MHARRQEGEAAPEGLRAPGRLGFATPPLTSRTLSADKPRAQHRSEPPLRKSQCVLPQGPPQHQRPRPTSSPRGGPLWQRVYSQQGSRYRLSRPILQHQLRLPTSSRRARFRGSVATHDTARCLASNIRNQIRDLQARIARNRRQLVTIHFRDANVRADRKKLGRAPGFRGWGSRGHLVPFCGGRSASGRQPAPTKPGRAPRVRGAGLADTWCPFAAGAGPAGGSQPRPDWEGHQVSVEGVSRKTWRTLSSSMPIQPPAPIRKTQPVEPRRRARGLGPRTSRIGLLCPHLVRQRKSLMPANRPPCVPLPRGQLGKGGG